MVQTNDTLFSSWGIAEQGPGLIALVDEARANEEGLRRRWEALAPWMADALLWHMVAAGVPEAQEWTGTAPLASLCERALALRGGHGGGRERALMRERARVLLHLTQLAPALPREATDLLAWWDEATRLEPLVRLSVDVPRWRTAEDGLPFTGMRMAWLRGPLPLSPGQETAEPEDIPTLAEGLVWFVSSGEMEPEVVAAHVPHLVGYIHPFVDGNGHTGRLLMGDLLSRSGCGAQTLLAYVGTYRAHAHRWSGLLRSTRLGETGAGELVAFQLRLLVEAQRSALDASVSSPKP